METKKFTSHDSLISFMEKNFTKCKKAKGVEPYNLDFEFFKLILREGGVFHCNLEQLFTNEYVKEGATVKVGYEEVDDETEKVKFKRIVEIEIKCKDLSAHVVYSREDPSAEGFFDNNAWKDLSKEVKAEGEEGPVFIIKNIEKKSGGVE